MAEASAGLQCDVCIEENITVAAMALCKQCEQLYCIKCLKRHKRFTASKDHLVVEFGGFSDSPREEYPKCDVCLEHDEGRAPAVVFCVDCWQFYCDSCKRQHKGMKATKQHTLHQIPSPNQISQVLHDIPTSNQTSQMLCDSISLSSDFEELPPLAPETKCVPDDSVSLSSDFEEMSLTATKEIQKPESCTKFLVNQGCTDNTDKISAQIVCRFSAKIASDSKVCVFIDIICLNDGRLILQDYGNHKIKMFNNKFYPICFIETKSCNGMTKVSEREIAIVGNKAVYLYDVTNAKFKYIHKKFKIDGEGYRITYNGNIYAITCDIPSDHPYIQILSKFGEKLYRIESFGTTPGYTVSLDSQGDSIYISPRFTDGKLSCLSREGKIRWKTRFCGGDVLELGNSLLVTSDTDNALYEVTKDGSYSRIIIQDKDRLHKPEHIAYNPVMQHIYVTCARQDKVTILQLVLK